MKIGNTEIITMPQEVLSYQEKISAVHLPNCNDSH